MSLGQQIGMTRGLLTRFEVQPDRDEEAKVHLKSVMPLVAQARATLAWFAMRFAPAQYGIIDFFPNEQARAVHLAGPVGQYVLGTEGPLSVAPAHVERFDVLAAHLAQDANSDSVRHGLLLRFSVKEFRRTEVDIFLRQSTASMPAQCVMTIAMAFGEKRYGLFGALDHGGAKAMTEGFIGELANHSEALTADESSFSVVDIVAAKIA